MNHFTTLFNRNDYIILSLPNCNSRFFLWWRPVEGETTENVSEIYRKVPKFSDARKHCCNLPKIQTKTPNLREFLRKGANGIANSEDPDQTAP